MYRMMFTAVWAIVSASMSSAQSIVRTINGAPGDFFGTALVALPDMDGDGKRDLAIGAPQWSPAILTQFSFSSSGAGRAEIRSSASGAVLVAFNGVAPGSQFGYSIAAMPDLDADGFPEIAVGAPSECLLLPCAGQGRVRICSPLAGVLGAPLSGPQGAGRFGNDLATIQDANLDGVDDLVVGAPFSGSSELLCRVEAYSGASRNLLYLDTYLPFGFPFTITPNYGYVVASMGDINGDGRGDYAVGNYGSYHVALRSGVNGSSIIDIWWPSGFLPPLGFGTAISGGVDLNNDGVNDVLVGNHNYTIIPGMGWFNVTVRPRHPSGPLRRRDPSIVYVGCRVSFARAAQAQGVSIEKSALGETCSSTSAR